VAKTVSETAIHVRRFGPLGLLLRPYSISPAELATWIRGEYANRIDEAIPGATTVAVQWRTAQDCDEAAVEIAALTGAIAASVDSGHEPLICPVSFDGPDLSEVAQRTGRSVAEIIATMTSTNFEVAFCGFAPGFGYLTGLPEFLHLPRRPSPRPRIEAGSVAVAAGYAAIYPSRSPGGWHLLGRCDLPLWDLDRTPPALMIPGRQVRFIELDRADGLRQL
jgi:KipI family sensor histidine kinase inhibitor